MYNKQNKTQTTNKKNTPKVNKARRGPRPRTNKTTHEHGNKFRVNYLKIYSKLLDHLDKLVRYP